MSTKAMTLPLAVTALAISAAAAFAEGAAEPTYIGTWASDLAQCKVAQDRQEAPLVLSKDGYDQYETHCKFTSVDSASDQWKVKSDCTVEGSAEPYDFTMTVSGDTLTIADDTGSRDLLMCK